MKVILLEDVKKVGKKDEIVDVSQGYANNVLFKKNLAVEADKKGLSELKARQSADNEKYQADKEDALKKKKELENQTLVFKLKSGSDGRVFGSISHKQVIAKLKEMGYKVNKTQLEGEPVKHIGFDKMQLNLHKEVSAEIKIKVEEE